MAGRPAKPILLKKLHGDTRKIGARKHKELIDRALGSRRGAPPYPDELLPREMPPELAVNAQMRRAFEVTEARRAVARQHYDFLVEQLGIDEMLCPLDRGLLVSAAWTYALAQEAAEDGSVNKYAELQKIYVQMADRLGLNALSRSKMPKAAPQQAREFDLDA